MRKSKKAQPKPRPPIQSPLLVDFCNARIRNYTPPVRTRREKGTKTLFSKAKYETTVLALIDWDDPSKTLRGLAKKGKTSYSVVRRWVTEEVFKEKVQEHIEAFVPVFFGYLRGWQGRYAKAMDAVLAQSLSAVTYTGHGGDHPALLWEIKDKLRPIYSPRLSILLCDLLLEELKHSDDVPWMNVLLVAADILCGNPWLENQRREFLKHRQHRACHIINVTSKAIAKPKIPVNDKKGLLVALDMLSTNIREGRL